MMSGEDTLMRYLKEYKLSDERRYKLGEANRKLKEERMVREKFMREYEDTLLRHEKEKETAKDAEVLVTDQINVLTAENHSMKLRIQDMGAMNAQVMIQLEQLQEAASSKQKDGGGGLI